MKEIYYYVRASLKIASFFRYNSDRILAWMEADNPAFGNVSAADMIKLGRGKTLLRIIDDMLSQSKLMG